MFRMISLLITVLVAAPGFSQKLTILHTNDMHSRLWGFGPEADYSPLTTGDDHTVGGFSRIASVISGIRAGSPESVLVVDAGDFLMGTVFHTAEAETGFQLGLMKQMGYDLVGLGNHEFDFGPGELAKIVGRAADRPIPGLILSNAAFDPSSDKDDALEAQFTKGNISRYRIVERGGLRIGAFALIGADASSVAPNAKPVVISERLAAAGEYVRILKEQEKVDLVICLSHSGLAFDPKKGWLGEDAEMARQVPGIDIIISGHTHTSLNKPLIINNVPIVSAGSEGRYVGRLDIEKTGEGISVTGGELIPVDDRTAGDPLIQGMIEDQRKLIGQKLFAGYGFTIDKPVVETAFDLGFNSQTNLSTSTLGPFLADALYWYARKVDEHPTDVALVTAGLTRDEILVGRTGSQLPADLFRILPLGMSDTEGTYGYGMSKIYVTGRELKNILDVMLLARNMSTDYYGYWSGVRYKVNTLRVPLDRVYEVEIGNDRDGYRKIDLGKDPDKLYGIVSNAYVMKFFGIIKSTTGGILKVIPKAYDGTPLDNFGQALIDRDPASPGVQEAKEWVGLMSFAAQFPDINGNGIPDIPEKYRTATDPCAAGPSANPVLCYRGTNGINVVPGALLTLIAGTIALIAIF